jgi:hypothetical protein
MMRQGNTSRYMATRLRVAGERENDGSELIPVRVMLNPRRAGIK